MARSDTGTTRATAEQIAKTVVAGKSFSKSDLRTIRKAVARASREGRYTKTEES